MQKFGGFNPERNLNLTNTYPIGDNNIGLTEAGFSAVFACDFTGLDGTNSGLIFESGGSALGCYFGFRPNGDLVWRTGNGGTPWSPQTSYILVPMINAPNGSGTMVWQVEMTGTTQKLKIWWNGVEIGIPVNQSTESVWAGSNKGTYLNTSSILPAGEVATPVSYNTASSLRSYENQIVT